MTVGEILALVVLSQGEPFDEAYALVIVALVVAGVVVVAPINIALLTGRAPPAPDERHVTTLTRVADDLAAVRKLLEERDGKQEAGQGP